MPKLKPSGGATRRGLNPSNGLATNSASPRRRFQPLSQVDITSEPEDRSTSQELTEIQAWGETFVSLWDGKSALTDWPKLDWFQLLKDETWQPIWDRQPLTSSMLWARWITGRDGRADPNDYRRPFQASSKPMLQDEEQRKRFDHVWAVLQRRIAESRPDAGAPASVDTTPSSPSLGISTRVDRASSDEAIRELAYAESANRHEAIALCPTTNKVKHRSKLWALVHRNRLASSPDERHPERLEAYKCRWCGGWHVGHRVAA